MGTTENATHVINRRRGILMLLDVRIGLVAKSYGEVGRETIKRCKTAVKFEGLGAVSVIFRNFSWDI